MPFVKRTKGSMQQGLQTFERVMRLAPEIRDAELEYLDIRDWYMKQLAIEAQFEEERAQAERSGDGRRERELSHKLHGIKSSLHDVRERVKLAGMQSYESAFYMLACRLLPPEVRRALDTQTERLLGRGRSELARKTDDMSTIEAMRRYYKLPQNEPLATIAGADA